MAPGGGTSSSSSPGRFAAGALLGVLLFLPAAFLVWRGQLSADDALLRFGLAWLVAVGGVALVSAACAGAELPDAVEATVGGPAEGGPGVGEPEA